MKNKLSPRLLMIISLIIISAFVYYLYVNAEQYKKLLQVSVEGVAVIFLLSLAFPLLNGMQNIYLYRSLGAVLSVRDGFYLTAASTLANQLPISGGIVSKAVYLNYRYELSYMRFISSTLALYLCFISINGFIGLTILLSWIFIYKTPVTSILLIAYGVMAACLLFFRLPLGKIRLSQKMHMRIERVIEGLEIINNDPTLLWRLVILQVILVFLLALRYWFALHMLSQNVTIGQTMLFASSTILTQLVSIAPGGLGVREAIVGAVAVAIGLDPGTTMVAVGLDRLVSTVMIVLTGWLSILMLGKEYTGTSMQSDNNNGEEV